MASTDTAAPVSMGSGDKQDAAKRDRRVQRTVGLGDAEIAAVEAAEMTLGPEVPQRSEGQASK